MLFLLVLFCCLVASSVRCSPAPERHHENERVRKEDDVSLEDLRRLVQQQASIISQLEAKVNADENRMDALASQQLATQRKVEVLSKSVAFTARISAQHDNHNHGMPLGDQQIVVFDSVVTNVGNAYDPKTGIFTAPVDGLYVFFLCELGPLNSSDLFLAIVKNGAVLDLVYAEGGQSFWNEGCSQVTTSLTGGDRVWVRQHRGNLVRGDWWTIYTGFLLHAE